MKIALLGDVALIGRYDRTINTDVDKRVECIKHLVSDCDFVIANQESVLTDRTKTMQCKGVYLRSAAENVKTLKYIGVTHVTLANNHIFDYGTGGMKDTLQTLSEAGIKAVGLCDKPAVLKQGNSTVMLDGFCCLTANALRYGEQVGYVQLLTYNTMHAFLSYAEQQNCLPIASVHFGIEGLHYPAAEHIDLFRRLSQNHNYILHGNHPHAMQGIETVNNSLLIYAQGNLCFDDCTVTSIHEINRESTESRKGYVVILEIEDNKIKKYDVIPVTDNDSGNLHINDAGTAEINRYSDVLKQPIENIVAVRKTELKKAADNAQKRGIIFYLHRLNLKYIGAFINGKLHYRRYKNILRNDWGDNV